MNRAFNHIITQCRISHSKESVCDEEYMRGKMLRSSLRSLCETSVKIGRTLIHYRFSELPRYEVNNNEDDDYLQYRIQYLRNQLEEQDFKQILQRKDKINKKKQDISNVFTMFINTSTDVIYRFVEFIEPPYSLKMIEEENIKEAEQILNEVNAIVKYVNECLQDIGKSYNVKSLEVSDFPFRLSINSIPENEVIE